ncbi:MAG TPA: LysR family transcriptional regulator [Rhodobacter sp.]|nr:LysR family transcriptional regulator [Paracoccaceae bacterium]MDO7662150.1 LysR family transcriptional regulator [Planktomarina temperata]HAQ46389.1 LysR family transcriptional regulator [Rhodobacter sp.]HCM99474.1 LysR family transcriptional regulator [Rhodobacter sp.]
MPTRIDYIGIEAFVAIAQLGNFVRASAHLNLSQAALSHRIRKLEDDIGTRLLLRTTREVSLTEAGQEFLPIARRNLEALSTAYSAVQTKARAQQQTLTFACLPTIAHFYLPHVLEAFAISHPDISIRLQEQPADRVRELVISGEAEFGVILTGVQRWDLEFKEVRREDYHLLVGPNHPLAKQSSVSLADLAGERFVRINTQSTNRQMVDDFLEPVAGTIDWRYEVQNAAMAIAMVMQGVAVTILPSISARLSGYSLSSLPFSDIQISRTLGIVTRRGAPLTAAAQAMRDQIITALRRDD